MTRCSIFSRALRSWRITGAVFSSSFYADPWTAGLATKAAGEGDEVVQLEVMALAVENARLPFLSSRDLDFRCA
jgi:hypothetical protein